MPNWIHLHCARCGTAISQRATGRPRRFCSPACKQTAYRVTKVNRKAYKPFEGTNAQADREAHSLTGKAETRRGGGEP